MRPSSLPSGPPQRLFQEPPAKESRTSFLRPKEWVRATEEFVIWGKEFGIALVEPPVPWGKT